MKESFFNARKLSAVSNEEHSQSQWTFGKFSSKIIGVKLQFSRALMTMCIISWNVYYAHFMFSTLAVQIYWESEVSMGCTVHAKWFALNHSPPVVAGGRAEWGTVRPCRVGCAAQAHTGQELSTACPWQWWLLHFGTARSLFCSGNSRHLVWIHGKAGPGKLTGRKDSVRAGGKGDRGNLGRHLVVL